LRLLDQELSKLLTYSANARAISAADVKLLVSGARERSVFEMVEALAGGNHKQAVALLQSLLDAGEQPLGILGMIAWQYRLLLQVKEQMSQGQSQEAAGAALGQKPFTMKKAWPQAQRLSLATLEWVMERLLDADIAIKTGQMEDRLALTVLISELSQRR
jgi:DNA polymerase-3 subunit delta